MIKGAILSVMADSFVLKRRSVFSRRISIKIGIGHENCTCKCYLLRFSRLPGDLDVRRSSLSGEELLPKERRRGDCSGVLRSDPDLYLESVGEEARDDSSLASRIIERREWRNLK